MFTLAQSYNSGNWRRIANRSGELRHEEFSHCYIHESVGREKFRRTSSYNFSNNHFKTFGERRRTNRECKRNSEKLFKKVISCFSSVLFLVLSVPDGTLGLNDTERVGPSFSPPPLFSVSAHFSYLVDQRDEERKLHHGAK